MSDEQEDVPYEDEKPDITIHDLAPDDKGHRMKITKQSLGVFSLALCGSLGFDPENEKAALGVWLLVQQAHEAVMEADGIPSAAKYGSMNRMWQGTFVVSLYTLMTIAKEDKSAEQIRAEVLADPTTVHNLHQAVEKAVETVCTPRHYALGLTVARILKLFSSKYDLEKRRKTP